jgi:hypothetical protein
MLALCISGIDLKTFALTSCFTQDKKNVIISLDANKTENILLIEASVPLKIEEYKNYITKAQDDTSILYQKFKKFLIKRLI